MLALPLAPPPLPPFLPISDELAVVSLASLAESVPPVPPPLPKSFISFTVKLASSPALFISLSAPFWLVNIDPPFRFPSVRLDDNHIPPPPTCTL